MTARRGLYDAAARMLYDNLPKGVLDPLKITLALADVIQALGEVPEMTLYSALFAHNHTGAGTFDQMLAMLANVRVIERRGKLLVWLGHPPTCSLCGNAVQANESLCFDCLGEIYPDDAKEVK